MAPQNFAPPPGMPGMMPPPGFAPPGYPMAPPPGLVFFPFYSSRLKGEES